MEISEKNLTALSEKCKQYPKTMLKVRNYNDTHD